MASLRVHARRFLRLILSQHLSPVRVALALWLGFVVGFTPTFGIQFFLCALLATVLRLNLPIMYAAANVSIPPMIPLIGFASVQVGEYLRFGHFVALSRTDFAGEHLHATVAHFFYAWLRGGILLGSAVGAVVGGGVFFWLLRRRSANPTSNTQTPDLLGKTIEQAATQFAFAHPRYRYYARYKYRLDPVYRVLCERIPQQAELIDLGCGLGMLEIALSMYKKGKTLRGIDWDAEKIAVGKQAAASFPHIALERADIHTFELPSCDAVTLIDVLHYYDREQQDQLLARVFAALRPEGVLWIRETDAAARSGITRLFERMMVRFGWNIGPKVVYRTVVELSHQIQSLGFSIETEDLSATTHPGNVLLTCRKPADTGFRGPQGSGENPGDLV